MRLVVGSFACSVVLLFAGSAFARPQYLSYFPNSSTIDGNGCINCHLSAGGGGSRNSFGNAMANAGLNWSSVCHSDSDGDGQTNGQELGDPDCVWTQGASPERTSAISNPGKSSSTSSNPNGGSHGGGEGEGEGEGEGQPSGSWMCDPSWQGDGSCDCGCGAPDPDCASNSLSACDYNDCDAWQPTHGLQPDGSNPALCAGGIAPGEGEGEGEGGGTCPAHSSPTPDGGACACDPGFVPNATHDACVASAGEGEGEGQVGEGEGEGAAPRPVVTTTPTILPPGCSSTSGGAPLAGLVLALAGLRRRRRR